jgi:hypothetical protein
MLYALPANLRLVTDTKSYPIHKSVVSTIQEERRGSQSLVAWGAWTHRCAAFAQVPRGPNIDAIIFPLGLIQPTIWWWWFLWWRRRLTKSGATEEQGSCPPCTRGPRGPVQGQDDQVSADTQRDLSKVRRQRWKGGRRAVMRHLPGPWCARNAASDGSHDPAIAAAM